MASTDLRSLSPKKRLLLFVLIAAPAMVIVLSYFGVIPWRPSQRCRAAFCDPYHWQILVLGIGFLFTSLVFVIPPDNRPLARLNGMAMLVCFVAGVVGTLFFR